MRAMHDSKPSDAKRFGKSAHNLAIISRRERAARKIYTQRSFSIGAYRTI